jgi:hypothetical protein
MRNILTALIAAGTIATAALVTANSADAQWGASGWPVGGDYYYNPSAYSSSSAPLYDYSYGSTPLYDYVGVAVGADANGSNHRDRADHSSDVTIDCASPDRDYADHDTQLRHEQLFGTAL